MEDNDVWNSSKTTDNAANFFDEPFDESSDISLFQLKEEFTGISISKLNLKTHDKQISNNNNYDIVAQNTFIGDETGEVAKWEKNIRKCSEIDAKVIIKKIIAHEECSFKKFDDILSKLLLLDVALKMYEENSIIKILIFVNYTLTPFEFVKEISKRPLAVRIYISYLKRSKHYDKLFDFYGLMKKNEESAMLRLKNAMQQPIQIDRIKQCFSSHIQPNFLLYFESSMLQEYFKLVQLQNDMQKEDNVNGSKSMHYILNRIPLKIPLINRSLIGTLQYACFYHYNDPENRLSSPAYLRKEFQISNKRFEWQCLKTKCILSHFRDIDKIFLTKNFFGMIQLKSALGFEKVILLLRKHNAPKEILSKFCDLIEDIDQRIELAKICECNDCLIMAYKQTRNKSAFDLLRRNLKQTDPAYQLALQIQNDSVYHFANNQLIIILFDSIIIENSKSLTRQLNGKHDTLCHRHQRC